jgi:hypothetical protein
MAISPVKISGRFGGKYFLYLQGQRSLLPPHTGFFLGSFFDPEDGGDMFLRNVVLTLTDQTALYHRKYNSST